MADKITLIEFHAHTDSSDFSVQPSLGSGVGKLAKSALSGGTDESESQSEGIVESLTSSDEADSEDEEIEYGEEFDEDEGSEDDESDDDGAGKGTGLVGIIALVVLVLLTRKFLGDDDEDPFEEEFGQ